MPTQDREDESAGRAAGFVFCELTPHDHSIEVRAVERETAAAFILGFLRRDFGAAGLYTLAQEGRLDPVGVVVAVTTITLFVPCIANFFMIVKERGVKVACTLLAVITPIAIFTGAGLHYVFDACGIRF